MSAGVKLADLESKTMCRNIFLRSEPNFHYSTI